MNIHLTESWFTFAVIVASAVWAVAATNRFVSSAVVNPAQLGPIVMFQVTCSAWGAHGANRHCDHKVNLRLAALVGVATSSTVFLVVFGYVPIFSVAAAVAAASRPYAPTADTQRQYYRALLFFLACVVVVGSYMVADRSAATTPGGYTTFIAVPQPDPIACVAATLNAILWGAIAYLWRPEDNPTQTLAVGSLFGMVVAVLFSFASNLTGETYGSLDALNFSETIWQITLGTVLFVTVLAIVGFVSIGLAFDAFVCLSSAAVAVVPCISRNSADRKATPTQIAGAFTIAVATALYVGFARRDALLASLFRRPLWTCPVCSPDEVGETVGANVAARLLSSSSSSLTHPATALQATRVYHDEDDDDGDEQNH